MEHRLSHQHSLRPSQNGLIAPATRTGYLKHRCDDVRSVVERPFAAPRLESQPQRAFWEHQASLNPRQLRREI